MEERKVNYLTFGNHLSMYSKVDYSFWVRFHQLNGGSGGEHVRLGPPDLVVAQVVSAINQLLGIILSHIKKNLPSYLCNIVGM